MLTLTQTNKKHTHTHLFCFFHFLSLTCCCSIFSQVYFLSLVMNEMSRNERESSEERKLELRLAPPGVENWFHTSNNNNNQRDLDNHDPKLSLGSNYFSTNNTSFLHFPSNQHVRGKESSSSQAFCPKLVELQNGDNNKVTAVSNTSQKRTAPGPVVGWPPIRSFRKKSCNNKQQF